MLRSLAEKIWDEHVVARLDDGRDLLYVDRLIMDEMRAPQALKSLAASDRTVRRPDLTYGVIDHSIGTLPGRGASLPPEIAAIAEAMRVGAKRYGFRFFDIDEPEQGIAHVVAPELGLVLPGTTYVCSDSHAPTAGALGALSFSCGTSDLEHVLATQVLPLERPFQMRIRLEGALQHGVSAKDAGLHAIGVLGNTYARGFALEFGGTTVQNLGIEGRLTLCNMAVEMGAKTALVGVDATTIEWLAGRPCAPAGRDWESGVAYWKTLTSDGGAPFDRDLTIDCSALAPQITFGTDASHVIPITGRVPDPASVDSARRPALERALAYMGLAPGDTLEGLSVDRVFIGSCTNARFEDLAAAAAIVRGRRKAEHVRVLVVPGSSTVKRQAEAAGLDRIFRDAGFEWHESGCSMCSAGSLDAAAPAERCLSTSNRNSEHRQGRDVLTHLVSPATAAAAAIAGRIVDVRRLMTPA